MRYRVFLLLEQFGEEDGRLSVNNLSALAFDNDSIFDFYGIPFYSLLERYLKFPYWKLFHTGLCFYYITGFVKALEGNLVSKSYQKELSVLLT